MVTDGTTISYKYYGKGIIMTTSNEIREQLVAAVQMAKENYATIVAEQLAIYPFEDTTAWDALTMEQKVAEWSRKNHAEGLIKVAEKHLRDFDNKVAAFYGTLRQAAFDEFEAERAAAKNELAGQWQAKEDYAKATGDWELLNYAE